MKLIFPHIPKTAGSSVVKNFRSACESMDLNCNYTTIATGRESLSREDFPNYDLSKDWNFVTGHIPLSEIAQNPAIDKMNPNVAVLTVLRDPVDRLISLRNFIFMRPKHWDYNRVRAMDGIDYIRLMSKQTQNLQSRYLELRTPNSWNFFVGEVSTIGLLCAECFEFVTGRAIDKAHFEQKHNTANIDRDELKRSDLPDHVARSIYSENSKDVDLIEKIRSGWTMTRPDDAEVATGQSSNSPAIQRFSKFFKKLVSR